MPEARYKKPASLCVPCNKRRLARRALVAESVEDGPRLIGAPKGLPMENQKKIFIHFFRDGGAISPAESDCVASFNAFDHSVIVWNVGDVLARADVLSIPPEFRALAADLEALDENNPDLKPKRGAICSALANWFKWIILAAPPELDAAAARFCPDTDYFALTDPATWLADADAIVATHNGKLLGALIAMIGGKVGAPLFVDGLRFAPGHALANNHTPLFLQAGSPFLQKVLMDADARYSMDGIILAPAADFAAYGANQRDANQLPEVAALANAKAAHGWFRAYSNQPKEITNEQVVDVFKAARAARLSG